MKTAKDLKENQEINIESQQHNFIVIYDTLYKTNLTIYELGLITKLISCAPTFKPTILKLAQTLKCSKEIIKKATKGLKEKGFLTIENKFKSGSKWTINQEPIINKINGFTYENILNALLNCTINTNELKILWKRKGYMI